jgi:hypothetical protein
VFVLPLTWHKGFPSQDQSLETLESKLVGIGKHKFGNLNARQGMDVEFFT